MNKLYLISAMLIILLWSGLGHSKIVTFMGILTALWLPISLKLYHFLLRWMPLVEGHQARLSTESQQQALERFAAVLIAAGGTIVLLIVLTPSQAFATGIALNIIVLLLLFYMQQRWVPNSLLFLLLLSGLLCGALTGHAQTNIYAGVLAWLIAWSGLLCLSFLYRENYLSQRDILLFTACGSWCGLKAFVMFLPLTLVFLWIYSALNQHYQQVQPTYSINKAGFTVCNFLTPTACLTSLAITIFVKTLLAL